MNFRIPAGQKLKNDSYIPFGKQNLLNGIFNLSRYRLFPTYVVITIDIPNFKGSLYDQILQTYDNLLPIQIQNVNRIMTKIN